MRFSRLHGRRKHFLLASIRASEVIVGIVEHERGDLSFIAEHKEAVQYQGDFSLPVACEQTLKALGIAIDEVVKVAGCGVKNICVSIASPLSFSFSEHIGQKFESPTIVTEELLARIARSFDEVSESKSETRKMIERKIINVRLNGYLTHSPFYKKAREVSFVVFGEDCADDYLNKLRKFIEARLGGCAIEVHTRSFILFDYVRSFRHEDDFALIDIGSRFTRLIVSKDEGPLTPSGFSFGILQAENKVMELLGVSASEERGLIERFFRGHLSSEETERVKNAVSQARDEWLGLLLQELKKILDLAPMPRQIIVSAEPFAFSFFQPCLEVKNLQEVSFPDAQYSIDKMEPGLEPLRVFIKKRISGIL